MLTLRIAADGCDISQAHRDQAERLARRWPRFDPAAMGASLVFRTEGRTHTVEAMVTRRRRDPVVASGKGDSFRVALDQLDGHMTRRLKRDRTKRKDYRA